MPRLGLLYQSPCPCDRPLLTHTSAGDTQTLRGRSGSVSVGSPGVHKVLFEPSKCLWKVWGLILNAILPLLLSFWGFSFALGHGAFFFFFWCDPTSSCPMVVQQSVVILGFSQEKVSTCPSTLPSCDPHHSNLISY